jgi:hypothetical protein
MNNISTDDSMEFNDFGDSIEPIELIDLVEEDNLIDPRDVSRNYKSDASFESDRMRRQRSTLLVNKD